MRCRDGVLVVSLATGGGKPGASLGIDGCDPRGVVAVIDRGFVPDAVELIGFSDDVASLPAGRSGRLILRRRRTECSRHGQNENGAPNRQTLYPPHSDLPPPLHGESNRLHLNAILGPDFPGPIANSQRLRSTASANSQVVPRLSQLFRAGADRDRVHSTRARERLAGGGAGLRQLPHAA